MGRRMIRDSVSDAGVILDAAYHNGLWGLSIGKGRRLPWIQEDRGYEKKRREHAHEKNSHLSPISTYTSAAVSLVRPRIVENCQNSQRQRGCYSGLRVESAGLGSG